MSKHLMQFWRLMLGISFVICTNFISASNLAMADTDETLAIDLADGIAPLSLREASQWTDYGKALIKAGGQWTADKAAIQAALEKTKNNTVYAGLMKTPAGLYGLQITFYPPPADSRTLVGELRIYVKENNPSGPLKAAADLAKVEFANLKDVLPGVASADWQLANMDPGSSSTKYLAYSLPFKVERNWPPEAAADKLAQALTDFKAPRGAFLVGPSFFEKSGSGASSAPAPCKEDFAKLPQ